MLKIQHHLDSAELMSCASGTQPEALAAVISTHLSLCPECRRELKTHSLIGELLFHNLDRENITHPIKTFPQSAASPNITSSPQVSIFQNTLRLILSGQAEQLAWNSLAPGISDASLSLSKSSKGSLKLLKLLPNSEFGHLERTGVQIMLVLQGGLKNLSGGLSAGDIVPITPEDTSNFRADIVNGCICILASEKQINLQKLFH